LQVLILESFLPLLPLQLPDCLLARQPIRSILSGGPQFMVSVGEHASVLVRARAVGVLEVVAAELCPKPFSNDLIPFHRRNKLATAGSATMLSQSTVGDVRRRRVGTWTSMLAAAVLVFFYDGGTELLSMIGGTVIVAGTYNFIITLS
jgi:hypothetical protein